VNTYYRIAAHYVDIDHVGDDVLHKITEQCDPPDLSSDDLWDEDHDPAVIRATREEADQWSASFDAFHTMMTGISNTLAEAEKSWRRAKEDAADAYAAAMLAYKPVQRTIRARMDEIEDAHSKMEEELHQRAKDAEAARIAEEDRLHGPRLWAVTTRAKAMKARNDGARDMFVPTIHKASCVHAAKAKPVRIAAAMDALIAGARSAHNCWGWQENKQGDILPSSTCGRCSPDGDLAEFDPQGYVQWLEKTNAVQPPLPRSSHKIPFLINADAGTDIQHIRGDDGHVMVHPIPYRDKGMVAPYETTIGWWVRHGATVARDPGNALDDLFDLLPQGGWAVRRITDKNGNELKDVVAVRRMTKGEIAARDGQGTG
jgi:hypothetical protein